MKPYIEKWKNICDDSTDPDCRKSIAITDVDNATYEFLAIIKNLQSKMFKRVVKNDPVESFYYDSPTKMRLDYIKFKMKRLHMALEKYKDERDKYDNIIHKMEELDQELDILLAKLINERRDKDMSFQEKIKNRQSKKAYDNLSMFIHKEKGFGDKSKVQKTKEILDLTAVKYFELIL